MMDDHKPGAFPDDLRRAARRTMDLMFFAHVDQAARADEILADLNIGRPHHRLLYFAASRPGISVSELLSILRISNQALARTINQLTKLGLIEQRHGVQDRRVRHHHITDAGLELLNKVTEAQFVPLIPALAAMEEAERETLWKGLASFCRREDLQWLEPTARPEDKDP